MERKFIWICLLLLNYLGCNEKKSPPEQVVKATDTANLAAPVTNPLATSKPVNNLGIAEEVKFVPDNPEQRALVERYRQSINQIDETYKTQTARIELYMKLTGKKRPLRVKNFDRAPGSLEASYNIYRDPNGQVRYVLASPFNESGDWLNTFAHYFDEKGQTIAFVRTSNFFNSACTSEAASEISAYFFDQNHRLIQKMYELKDPRGKPLNPDSCVFNYRDAYVIFQNRDDLQKHIGID